MRNEMRDEKMNILCDNSKKAHPWTEADQYSAHFQQAEKLELNSQNFQISLIWL